MDRPNDVLKMAILVGVADIGDKDYHASVAKNVGVEENVDTLVYVDKGKGIMLEDDSLVRKKRKALSSGNGIVTTENENPSFDYDSESDTDTNRGSDNHDDIQMNVSSESESEESDRSFDYLSDEDAELLHLRKRRLQNKNTRDTSDDENIETEPESISPPKRVVDISDNATVLEHEAYMEALMKKLRGSKCGKKDPFTIVAKSGDKDKFPNAEKFKECLTYYALANGFSLWFYRSSKDKIIARCGQRKEKLKDPSKGKQRSYKKFPSETSGKTENRLPMEMLRQNDKGRNFISDEGEYAIEDHYGMVRSYAMALLESNVGSTVKGLNEALKEVMPLVEHRQCARHIYEGFQKSCMGVELRGLFWAASKASYPNMFNKIMDKIKRSNPNALSRALRSYPNQYFLELFFKKVSTVKIIPKDFMFVFKKVETSFEVRRGSDAFKVDEKAKTSSCRMWQLLGMEIGNKNTCGKSLVNRYSEPLHDSFPIRNNLVANAGNVIGPQQSQVVGVDGEGTSNAAQRTIEPRSI
ncbi:hypothetical protein Tco_1097536 [Tanacetum coccineum]